MAMIEPLEQRRLLSAYGPAGSVHIKGNWNGDAVHAGAVKNGLLYLDLNGDGKVQNASERFDLGITGGVPVVMDVNGNGRDEVGVFFNGQFAIDIDDDHTITQGVDLVVREAKSSIPIKAVKAVDVDHDGHKDLAIQYAKDKLWRVDFWRTTEDLPAFARALANSGTKFYGAFWCPHCRRQKEMFGDGFKKLPYVECSNPDHSENQIGLDNNITTYPTWVFPDSSRLTGEQPLQTLSDHAQVPIPTRANFAGNAKVTVSGL